MHFVATCDIFPQFAFNVPALRVYYKAEGREFDSPIVRFQNRVLDTKQQGYGEEESAMIRAALEKMTEFPPLIGTHILLADEQAPPRQGFLRGAVKHIGAGRPE